MNPNNVTGYRTVQCGRFIGNRLNGVCSVTFYTRCDEIPTLSGIYAEMVSTLECASTLVPSGEYLSDLMLLALPGDNTEKTDSYTTYSDESATHQYIEYELVRKCLDGVLMVRCQCDDNGNMHQQQIEYFFDYLFVNVLGQMGLKVPSVQMETAQGEMTQTSDVAGNTIITADKDSDQKEENVQLVPRLREICSTEDEYTFDSIVNRWMALPPIKVSVNNAFNEMINVYNLPKFLYTESFAPNLMPFQNFVYGNYDIEFKFVVNANKFHVGKVVCAVKNDSYQIDGIRNDVVDLLSRPHIVLDLSTNNEGSLAVPFKYHRTYVRNASAAASNFGIKDAQYATINMVILSQLRAVAGQPTSVDIRPFYRIKKAAFTGMSYGVPVVQMETILAGMVLERGLKFAGKIFNKDKPVDLDRQAQYVPKPRLNFSTGKGASDVCPIKMDPSTLTTFLDDHYYPDDPISMLDVARVWGFAGKFEWTMSQLEDTILYTQPIDPTWRINEKYKGVPTPLEYASSMYQFWSGPLEVRFDFVSNAFHTGSILISAEFGRNPTNLEQASSTYTKLFHLGDQKSVTFVIPYIFDTVWRRTQCVPFCSIQPNLSAGPYGMNAVLRTISSRITVRVVNALVPVSQITPTIDVLVFIRGGEHFTLHSPIMANLFNSEITYEMDNFPGQYAQTISSSALIQFTPSILKNKTGREMRVYWETLIPKPIKETRIDEVNPKSNIPITSAQPIDIIQRQKDRVNATIDRLLANAPNSGAGKLAQFQRKYSNYTSGYDISHYKFKEFNNTNFMFNIDNVDLAADLSSETIYDSMKHAWIPITHYHKVVSKFHDHAFKKFVTQLDITEIPTDEVQTQMDQGDMLNTDPTRVFKQGVLRNNVQTIDNHVNIKDLLRRPVMTIYNQQVAAFTGGNYYYIPCMPPSHMMALLDTNKPNRVYCGNLGRSYHVHINDMFRFWRGSQRWTIVTRNTTDVVYVAYIPHSGARVIGEIKWENVTAGSAPLGAFGLGTEMIIPSINPTLAIETPFDMEDNWALMFEEQANRNYTWRDKGDTNSGHLVLWSPTTFQYDLWWAAGDDFTVCNFLGVPPCINGLNMYYRFDNYPVVQMDGVIDTISRASLQTLNIASNALPYLPAISSTAAIGATCYTAHKTLKKTETAAEGLVQQISDLLSSVADKYSWSNNLVFWLTETIYDLILVFVNWNITTFAISLLRLTGRILGVSFKILSDYVGQIVEMFTEGAATQAGDPKEIISGPFWNESRLGKLVGLFIGLIGISTGVRYDTPGRGFIRSFISAFKDFRNIAYMNHVMRFISSIIELLMGCVRWCCSSVNLEISALEKLTNREDFLSEFVKESHTLLDESNANMFGNPAFKVRFWTHCIRARQIQREIVKLPTNQVSSVLTKMCGDVIRRGNEKMCDLRSSPVKYEPLVICISGPTKVGKSTLVRFLVPHLLKAMGIEGYASDPVYVRMQSSKHWNCYVDQPVVLIDEWLNITEPTILAEALNELYMLKSCATFIPEQAAIEDKKARASPKIVILLCNNAFPTQAICSIAPNTDAVLRRRDILLRVGRNATHETTNLRDMSPEDSENCAHIAANFYSDSCNSNSLQEETYSFTEMKDELCKRAKIYNEQEVKRVLLELKVLSNYCKSSFGNIDEDPFAIFYNHRITAHLDTQPNILPSEQLEAYLNILATRMTPEVVTALEASEIAATTDTGPNTQGFITNLKHKWDMSLEWIQNKILQVMGADDSYGTCESCGKLCTGFSVCMPTFGSSASKSHVICLACDAYLAPTAISLIDKKACPICKQRLVPIASSGKAALLQIVMRWKNHYDFRSRFMGKLQEYAPTNPIVKLLLFQAAVLLTCSVVDVAIKNTGNRDKYFLISNEYPPDIQADSGVLGGEPKEKSAEKHPLLDRLSTPPVNSRGNYGFNMKNFTLMDKELGKECHHKKTYNSDTIILDANCQHYDALENIHSVRYDHGKFVTIYNDEYAPLPTKPCNDLCMWQYEAERLKFCKAYFEAHIANIREILTANALDDTKRDQLIKRYPLFMFPTWFSVPKHIIVEPNWFEKMNIPDCLKTAMKVAGGLLAVFGLFKGMGWIFTKLFGAKDEIQGYTPSGDETIRHFKPKVSHVTRKGLNIAGVTQSMNVEDSVTEKVVNNYISIYIYRKDRPDLIRILTGIGIKQRIAVIPRHYYHCLKALDQAHRITLGRSKSRLSQIDYIFDERDFLVSETSDIAIFYMPASTNLFKDITSYMHTDEDYTKKRANRGTLVKVPNRHTSSFYKIDLDFAGFKKECTIRENNDFKQFRDLLEYNYSEVGACGSVVMVSQHQRPIIAMHVAGHGDKWDGVGYGVLLCKEMFDEILPDNVSLQAMDMEEVDFLKEPDLSRTFLPNTCNVEVLGTLSPEKTPYVPNVSKIQPSLISTILPWPPTRAPAILSIKDKRYTHTLPPIVAGCMKHGKLTKDFKTSDLELVKMARSNKLMNLKPTIMDPQRLDPLQAIAGFDYIDYYDSIKLDTSVGWPWCCSINTTKKILLPD
nr:MAG: polyprotein [Iflaviridae sp. XZN139912]